MTNEEVQVVSALMAMVYMRGLGEVTPEQSEKVQNVIKLIEPIAHQAEEDETFIDKVVSILLDYADKQKKDL